MRDTSVISRVDRINQTNWGAKIFLTAKGKKTQTDIQRIYREFRFSYQNLMRWSKSIDYVLLFQDQANFKYWRGR